MRIRSSVPIPLLAMAVLTAGLTHAAEFNVSDTTSFQSALDSAAINGEHDLITVAAGTIGVSTTLNYASGEARGLIIRGAGLGATVLDGGLSRQVLSIDTTATGGDITIEQLSLQHGHTDGSAGGALLVNTVAGNIVLHEVEVRDSEAMGTTDVGGGAAVASSSGDVTVTSSRFLDNTSHGNVGGLFMSTVTGSMLLSDSWFEGNQVIYGGGNEDPYGDAGGAQLYSDGGPVADVRGSTFVNNSTTGGLNPDGGGLMVYLLGEGGTADVRDSVFGSNTAGLNGGGLWIRVSASGDVVVRNNTMSNNMTTVAGGAGLYVELATGSLDISGNTFALNQAGGPGGGMWISHVAGTATLTDNEFLRNHAGENGGGALIFTEGAAATITGHRFWSNTSANIGGGLSYATTFGSLMLDRSTFNGNVADGGSGEGGGLYVYLDDPAAPTTVRNLIVWGNNDPAIGFSTGTGGGTLDVVWSDVQGGGGGLGSITAHPLFVGAADGLSDVAAGGDLHLATASSPVVDSGDPTSPSDPDGSRADMGAWPWDPSYLLEDRFESGLITAWTSWTP